MRTKTLPELVIKAYKAVGGDHIVNHEYSERNILGQSGAHTFACDVISIVLESKSESDAYKNILTYLSEGKI